MKHCVQATHWRTSRDRDRAEKNVQCTEAHTLMGKASRTQWKKIRKQNENKNEKTVKNSEKWEKRDFEWMTRQWKQCRQKVVAKVKKHWITTSKKRRKREKKANLYSLNSPKAGNWRLDCPSLASSRFSFAFFLFFDSNQLIGDLIVNLI